MSEYAKNVSKSFSALTFQPLLGKGECPGKKDKSCQILPKLCTALTLEPLNGAGESPRETCQESVKTCYNHALLSLLGLQPAEGFTNWIRPSFSSLKTSRHCSRL